MTPERRNLKHAAAQSPSFPVENYDPRVLYPPSENSPSQSHLNVPHTRRFAPQSGASSPLRNHDPSRQSQSPFDESNGSFVSSNRSRRLSASTEGSPSKKPSRNSRPSSFADKHPHYRSFIAEAASSNDFDAIAQGLDFALGTDDSTGHWFPSRAAAPPEETNTAFASGSSVHVALGQTRSKRHRSRSARHEDLSPVSLNEGFDNIPLRRLSPTRKSLDYPYSLELDDDTTLSIQKPPYKNLPGPFLGRIDLEAGSSADLLRAHLSDSHNVSPSGIPSKVTNLLSRVLERVAGPGKDKNKNLHADMASIESREPAPDSAHGSLYTLPSPSRDQFHHISLGSGPSLQVPSSARNSRKPRTGLALPVSHDSENDHAAEAPVRISGNSEDLDIPIDPGPAEIGDGAHTLYGNSLRLFPPSSKFRQWCHKVTGNSRINKYLFCLLLLQVALLNYRQWNPKAMNGYFYSGYNWADWILVVINITYTIEMSMKIVAYGFIDDRAAFEGQGIEYPCSKGTKLILGSALVKFSRALWTRCSAKFSARPRPHTTETTTEYFPGSSEPLNYASESWQADLGAIKNFTHFDVHRKYSPTSLDFSQNRSTRSDLSQHYNDSSSLSEDANTSGIRTLTHLNTLMIQPPRIQKNFHRAYLRSSWSRIDFISIVCFWISLPLSINRYDAKHQIFVFRALSCIRILRLCNLSTGTSTVLNACRMALPQLVDVSIIVCCFWLMFGIIGVQLFKSSLTRHCEWENPDDSTDTYINDSQYCGSYLDLAGVVQAYILRDGTSSSVTKGFTCPRNSKCVSGDNPYGGYVNFDNIFQSLELVFVVISANTFTDLMYDTMDSDTIAACLFYIASIFVLTVWLLNVFISILVASYIMIREKLPAEPLPRKKSKVWFPALDENGDFSMHSKELEALKTLNKVLRMWYRFQVIWPILVFLNILTQCFRTTDMTASTASMLFRSEVAFTGVFAFEIAVRFLVYCPHWRIFFAFKRNCFDLFLALTTVLIICIKEKIGHVYYWLTVFQIMRFYRVVIASRITRNLWLKIMGNYKSLFDLALFYLVLTYLLSIILARYFEGVIPLDELGEVPFAMDTLPSSFISLYIITTTENWTEILYSLQQYSLNTFSRMLGAMFLTGWFVCSYMVLIHFFIAVIAATLEISESKKRSEQLLQFIDIMGTRLQRLNKESDAFNKFKKRFVKKREGNADVETAVVNLLLSGNAVQDFLNEEEHSPILQDDEKIRELPKSRWKRWLHVTFWRSENLFSNPFYSQRAKIQKSHLSDFNPAHFARNIIKERDQTINRQTQYLKKNPTFNKVFYVMGPRHPIRRLCQFIVSSSHGDRIHGVKPYKPVHEAFLIFMFLATAALLITTCYLTPLYRYQLVIKEGFFNWAFWLEAAFLGIFSLEFGIKVLADGLIFTPNAYIRSSWNFIDFIVLLALWIEFIALVKNDAYLSRFVRGLKALRALRLLTISETAKNNFHNTIIAGFGKIINAAIISLCLLFPYAVWGLNVFVGRLSTCLDGESSAAMCINEYQNQVFDWEVLSPNVYVAPNLNFDRFSKSFLSLYEIISLEGWTDLLQSVMKSTGVGTPVSGYASPFAGIFVVVFNALSTIFILTLFVSVIINNYSRSTGRAYMTTDQISWYQVKSVLSDVQPSKRMDPQRMSSLRRFCFRMTIEQHTKWRRFQLSVLFIHFVTLLMEYFPEVFAPILIRAIIQTITVLIVTVNCLMKLYAGSWNSMTIWRTRFLMIALGAFITNILGWATDANSTFGNIHKLFLVALLLLVIPESKMLSQLLKLASASFPQLISLSFTWLTIFLMFAIALNQIFGTTKIGPNTTHNINVRSVPKALILLFRCSFGEGWNYIMDDFMLSPPFCVSGGSHEPSDCGSKPYAYILFCGWNITSMYIFLNMFVSLILDTFNYAHEKPEYSLFIDRDEIRKFKRLWQKLDPRGTGFIPPEELPAFLQSLEGTFSLRSYRGELTIPNLCAKWITRHNPQDPYDIAMDLNAINVILDRVDVSKIRARRCAVETFIEEAHTKMELNEEPGISFTQILLLLPLYTNFEAGKCLNLIDFLDQRLLRQKVERRLRHRRAQNYMKTVACRWKYLKLNSSVETDNHIFGLKSTKRFSNGGAPSIHVTTHDLGFGEDPAPNTQAALHEDAGGLASNPSSRAIYIPKSPLTVYFPEDMPDSKIRIQRDYDRPPRNN